MSGVLEDSSLLVIHVSRVNEGLVIKVGDFGLAKDVYVTDYYRARSKHARLPVKWMAPESFSDNISTEKTDVVSINYLWDSQLA